MNSKNNSPKSVPERASEARSLLEEVYNRMRLVLHPEEYTRFLNIVELFHWYSFSNILLIYFKFPHARYVAEYSVWEKTSESTYNDPNRMVLKRSEIRNAIRLIAPFTVINEATKARKLIPVSVSVYDVQQMNDLPIPENDFLDPRKYSVEDIANAINCVAPYRLSYASSDDKFISYNVKGYCNHNLRQFIVDGMLPPRALLYVLFHEYAEAEVFLSNYSNENLRRLVIESIYYVLIKHFGLSTENITFSYVGKFKDSSIQELARAFHTIQFISHSIIEKMEEHLEYIVDLLPVKEVFPYQTCFDDLDLLQGFDF